MTEKWNGLFDEDENSLLRHQNEGSFLENPQKVSPIKKIYSPRKLRERSPAFEIPLELDQGGDFIGVNQDTQINTQGTQGRTGYTANSYDSYNNKQSNGQNQYMAYGSQIQNYSHSQRTHNTNPSSHGNGGYKNSLYGQTSNPMDRYGQNIQNGGDLDNRVEQNARAGMSTPEKVAPHRKRPTPSGNKYHYAGVNVSSTANRVGRASDVSIGKVDEGRVASAPSNSFLVAAPASRLRQTISQLRFDLEKCQRQLDYEMNEKSELKIQIHERNDEVMLLRKQLDDFRDLRQLHESSNLEATRGALLSKAKEDFFQLQQEYNSTLDRNATLTDELALLKNEVAAKDSQLSRALMENREADSLLSTRSSRIQKLEQENTELKAQIERLQSSENKINQRSAIEVDELKSKIQELNNQLEIERTNVKKFEKRFEDTKTDLRILREQVHKYQDEIATKDSNMETLKQEIMDIKQMRDRNIEDTYYQQIEELKGRFQSKINSIHEDHEKKIQSMKRDHERTIQSLRSDYEGRIEEWKKSDSQSQDTIAHLQKELRSYVNKITVHNATQTQDRVYFEDDLLSHAKKYARPLEDEIQQLEADNSHLKEQNRKLEDQLQQIEIKVDSIRSQHENANSKQSEYERKIQHLTNHLQSVEDSYNRRSEQVKELEHELEAVSKQLQERKIETMEQISKFESEIKHFQQKISVNDMELKEKDRTILHLERSLKHAQMNSTDTDQISQHYSKQIKARDEELATMKRIHEESIARIKQDYERQIKDLNLQIKQSIAEISTRKTSYDTEMRDMRNENQSQQEKIMERDAKILKLKEYIVQLQEHYKDIKSKLQKSLSLANTELQRQKEILRTKDEQIKSLEKQHQILHSQALRSSSIGSSNFKIDP